MIPRRAAPVLAVLLLAGCGAGAAPAAPETVTVTAPAPSAPAPEGTKSWPMPDLVGTGLQEAQDRMQALTGNPVFFTRSHDATGAGRMQVSDRNWKVCDQNVPPGAPVTVETKIDFGAVKVGERC